ncbi:Galactoside 2-alpha-L-fucosyltransferase 2 [Mizuhopecten yessoensis]|uniref:L-Fucosyltransferase n=1 Tax=Mizuhopecten yessoensis TaxID=6573 RepID=A0A210QHC2_MIZYE|nr:Galactoside 2-alpha-L-fucosyltransferase 2 [Mizuhopecten yessoensis]
MQTIVSKRNFNQKQKIVHTTAQIRENHQTIENITSVHSLQKMTPEYTTGKKKPGLPKDPLTTTEKWTDQTVQDTGDQRFLVFRYLGRFGNVMFIYASCYSLALKHNRTLFMSKTDKIYQPFANIPSPRTPDKKRCKGKEVTFKQKRSRYYENLNLSETNASCVRIDGFLQSWKYFEDYFDDIRYQFMWKTSVREKALQTIKTLKNQTWPDIPSSNITTVGIHVRRGDYVTSKRPMADRAYFESAKEYFLKNFSNVLFIAITSPNKNDRAWCVDNIQNGSGVTVIAGSRDKFVDMALLSMTDHVIISTGTFGWWAEFLNKGRVLHFDWIPVNHSRFNRDDYILPHWIGVKAVNSFKNNVSIFQTVPL